jgi:5S rRNA maturation endonuclease (ribonuclease M5)
MRPQNIGQLLNKLQHVKTIGNKEWQADCPCPGHSTPGQHLHITDAGDKALVKCFTAHSYEDIIRSLGFESLTYGDGHRIEATYDYTDADGKLLYQVLRMSPKDFRQRRPDGNSDWIYNLKGVKRVLYRLPEVLEAVRNGQAIYVCEGEKDCDNLVKIGLTATTNSGGAEHWQPELSESLADASVVIIPDRDEPGKKHAAKVAGSLHGNAKSIKILELPDREGYKVKDVSDWIMAGGTKEELKRLANETSEYKPKEGYIGLVCIAEVEPETVEWLWFPYIPLAKLTLLEGDPGIGKSWVSLAIATAVSQGKGLPNMESTEPAKVLLASAEDGLGDTIRPRLDAMSADVTKIHAIKGSLDFGNSGLVILEAYIERLKPALVIIDPLVAYIGAAVDIHRANETRAVMAKLADIAERHSVAILAIRHLTKGGTLKPIYRGLGSIDLAAACRSILMAGCDPEDTNKRGIVHIKSNLAPMGVAIGYKLTSEGFYWTGESDLTWQKILSAEDTGGKSALDEAIEFLRDELLEGTVSYRQVIVDSQALGIAKRTLDRAKAQLGIIARPRGEPGRKGAKQWFWTLPGHLESQNGLHCQDDHIKDFGNVNQNSYGNEDLTQGFGNLNQNGRHPIGAKQQ